MTSENRPSRAYESVLENLETRRHFDAAPVAVIDAQTGLMTIDGTAGADTVAFQRVGKELRVIVNGRINEFPGAMVKSIQINVAGGDDKVIVGRRDIPVTIVGGDGNDTLSGGDGNDSIDGGAGNDYLFGRGGDDFLHGGADSDNIYGGKDFDTVDYSTRDVGVRVTVNNVADDGEIHFNHIEADNVHADVEAVVGGAGSDLIINETRHPLRIDGGAGNDTLVGTAGTDTLNGQAGNDVLDGVSGTVEVQ